MSTENIDLMENIILGTQSLLYNGYTFPFRSLLLESVENLLIIPSEGQNLNLGIEITFKPNVQLPEILIPADCVKNNNALPVSNISNIFELLPTALAWNKLFGQNKINFIGIDIFDEDNNMLDIILQNEIGNLVFKASSKVEVPINFRIKGVRIYFIEFSNSVVTFKKPDFILRILGSVIPDYFNLIMINYKNELLSYSILEENRSGGYVLPNLLNLNDFISYYDNLEITELDSPEGLIERKLFIQRVLNCDLKKMKEFELPIEMGISYELRKRTDRIFLPGAPSSINHLKANTQYMINSFHILVESSPDKCFICELLDIKDTYFAVFDNEFYQFDQIDITTPDLEFTELAKPEHSRNCRAIINGSFWGLKEIHKEIHEDIQNIPIINKYSHSFSEWVAGFKEIKANPQGHFVFRERINGVQKVWKPGDTVESVNGSNPKIVEEQDGENKCYFYETSNGSLVFSTGKLDRILEDIKNGLVSFNIAVGCDNLVGYMVNDGFDITPDTDFNGKTLTDFGQPSDKFLRKGRPELPEETSNGFPFFGVIERNNKKYLFFLVAEDAGWAGTFYINSINEYRERPDKSYEFLKLIGASNVMFTDGGSSASLIYNNTVIVKPSRGNVKNRIISTGIGIQPKFSFSESIVLNAQVSFGGDNVRLNNLVQLSSFPQNEKDQMMEEIEGRKSMPFIEHNTFPQHINSKFGPRTIDGIPGFHEGLDLRAQSPLNIKVNYPGKVFKVNSGQGFGNYIIINHGRDKFRNYYFSLYAHLSVQNVVENQLVSKGAVVGITGHSGPEGTIPHLHFELITVNKNIIDITYQDLLSRQVHLDPETFILPEALIID